MSAETALVAALDAAAPVVALVSTRIYPDARPQESTLPAIVYLRTGTRFEMTIHGGVALTRTQLGLGIYAGTRDAAEEVADAVHAALIAAGFIPLNRNGDFEDETENYIVAMLYEHIAT